MPRASNIEVASERAAVIYALQRLADQHVAIDAYGLLPSHAQLVARAIHAFGNLGAARDAASLVRGVPINAESDVPELLRDLADRGVRLTPADLRRVGEEQLLKQCYARFGSWPVARAAARLEAPVRKGSELPPREHVLDALRGRAGFAGVLRVREVDSQLSRVARHHFGTVGKAIDAAGLSQPKPNARWTSTKVVDELAERVATGGDVSVSALRREGRSDLMSAAQRFHGSLRHALHHARKRASRVKRRPGRRTSRLFAPVMPHVDPVVDDFVASIFEVARRRVLEEFALQLGIRRAAHRRILRRTT